MNIFKSKTREEQLTDYLVGDGLFNKIPKTDDYFYRLVGIYAHETWPTKPGGKPQIIASPETPASATTQEYSHKQQEKQHHPISKDDFALAKCDMAMDRVNSSPGDLDTDNQKLTTYSKNPRNVQDHLFIAKPTLPYPIFQDTYRKWKSGMDIGFRFRRLRRLRAALALQPLNNFPPFLTDFKALTLPGTATSEERGFFELLQDFMGAFFQGVDVRLNRAVSTDTWGVSSRINKITGQPQLLVKELNDGLATHCLSAQDYAVVGISWTDLYPSPNKNFVLGQASGEKSAASVSFGRFETNPREHPSGAPFVDSVTVVDGNLMWKMMKVLSHESCHIFNMAHCVFFDCLMNDSTSVSEAMSQPLYLCPVCLRKLQKVLRFPSVADYLRNLAAFYRNLADVGLGCRGLTQTVEWMERCAATIEAQNSRL